MTMPHLMNCSHSEDGWCVACVKELHDDCERLHRENKQGFDEAVIDGEKRYRDYLAMLPLAYAAEEWAEGRISATEFAATIASGFNDEVKGMELMSRLVYLEDENERLRDDISFMKAVLKRAREYAVNRQKKHPVGLREFASECGVSPTQMSEWTAGDISTSPDLF